MYTMGEAVAIPFEGQKQLGEVVGVSSVAGELLYDVSLEAVVVKAVMAAEVASASADEVRGALMAALNAPSANLTLGQAVLRKRHAEFLTRALALLEDEGMSNASAARYAVGQQVAAKRGNAWLLGLVRAVLCRCEEVSYDVEVQDELCRFAEADLRDLGAHELASAYELGARVRFVVAGHEGDDDYAGVVCALECTGDGVSYALMFDDGDVMEDLDASDLALT